MMKDFTDIKAPEPSDRNWAMASAAVSGMVAGRDPVDRMEAGLQLALKMGIDESHERVIEERRFEQAYAHALARNDRDGFDAPALASIDWARSFLVDASIQREAEVSLKLKPVDRNERHYWGAPSVAKEVWSQAGVGPSLFEGASEENLKSLAAGRHHELTGNTAVSLEIAVITAMAPGSPYLEHALAKNAVYAPPGKGLPVGRELVELADYDEFGRQNSGPDHRAMGAIADRMRWAVRSQEVGHRDARGLFDPTPGRNPFQIDPDMERRAERVVMGLDPSVFGQTVNVAAHMINQIDGMDQDMDGPHRLKMAAARLIKNGPNAYQDPKGDVRVLIADVMLQRLAQDTLEGRESPAKRTLATLIGGNPNSNEPVGFTMLHSERADTEAVAQGRFEKVSDARGIASGLRNGMWRASIVDVTPLDRAIDDEMRKAPRKAKAKIVSVAKGPKKSVVEFDPSEIAMAASRAYVGR